MRQTAWEGAAGLSGPPQPRLAALGAHVPSSPETGSNGSSDPAGLALPCWKSEPHKGQHCVLLRPPRGCEHGPFRLEHTPGSGHKILGKHQLNEKKKTPFFTLTKGNACLAALMLIFQNGNPSMCAYLLFKTIIYKLYLPTEKCNSNFQLTYVPKYQPPTRHPLPFHILLPRRGSMSPTVSLVP